jgi:DNA-binding LacI/PurR family transcriptional regulator
MRTIHDVAKAAGVSITTVSHALNGHGDVNEKTRQRVARIAKELGYRPNAVARNLREKRTDTIAFAPYLQHAEPAPESFFKDLIGTLAFDCFEHNLSLLVTLPDSEQHIAEMYRELANTNRVDGVILASIQREDPRIALLKEIGLPFVAFGRKLDETDLSYPFIDVDGSAGIRKLMRYLYGRGHRQIAYLSNPSEASYVYFRQRGYLESLQTYDLREDPRLMVMSLQNQEDTFQAVTHLLALPAEIVPSAIVTSNDWLALYVLVALRAQGRAIGKEPGQIAVASFDDLPFAAFVDPALTTICQPMNMLSKLTLELLVSILKQEVMSLPQTENVASSVKQLGSAQFLIEPDLIIRASA